MPGLQVLSAPSNQPTLNPPVQSAPTQPALAPRVLPQPHNAPILTARVQSQPLNQPTLNPAVQSQPQGQPTITSIGPIDNQQPYAQKMSVDEFAQLIKQKYPQYASQDNATLVKAMIAKYPEYADKVYIPDESSPEAPSVGGFVSNVATSGVDAVKNLLTAAVHPIDTLEGIAKIFYGAQAKTSDLTHGTIEAVPGFNIINKLLPDSFKQESKDKFAAAVDYFKQRYGSVDKVKQTIYKDPVGFLIDLSTALDAGGSAIAKVGDVSKIGEISKAGRLASKAGEAVNPVNIASKAASKAGNLAAESLGAITGAGAGAVKEAISNPSQGYFRGLTGKASPEEIVTESRQALGTVKADRAATYQSQLREIKNAPTKLDLTPLKTELTKQLSKFGVEIDEKGVLNFDSSTISDAAEQAKVKTAFDDIARWEKNPKNITPAGIDTLKRRLDNLYSPNSDVRALTTSLKNTTRKILIDNVPGYEQMTKGYQQASDFIEDVTKGLSLGDKASTDTALRKLSSALKQNNEFRTQLVKQLQDAGGSDLTGKIAGYNLSSLIPRSILGRGADVLALYGLVHAVTPGTLVLLAASSPKLVGILLGGVGLSTQATAKVVEALGGTKTLGSAAKATYQIGKMKNSQ